MSGQWRPIKTAPKDGTKIDVWVVAHLPPKGDYGYRVTNVRWTQKGWVRKIEDGDYAGEDSTIEWSVEKDVRPERQHLWASEPDRNWQITHWMPRPVAPPTDINSPKKAL